MPHSHKLSCINISRDLCLRLIERRAMSPDQLSVSMRLLTLAAENLFNELSQAKKYPVLGLARDITVKLTELGMVGSVQIAASTLAENGRMVAEVADQIDQQTAVSALKTARDLSLKMLETGRLSRASLPALFEELAFSVSEKTSDLQ